MARAFACASLAVRQFVFHGAKVDKPTPIFQQRLDKTKSPREKLSWAFGAMEGTRTPGLLIRRNPEAIFIHSEFYEELIFYTIFRYFIISLPLYSLHCLHLCASIFQFSDVQKMCKNVQRILMLEKIGIQLFLRAANSTHLSPRTVSFSS